MMEQAEIEKLIPHRPPFLWIDRVVELEPGSRCVAILNVSAENPVFGGHFPGRPIFPGVLMIEAVAQTAAVMLGAEGPAASALLASVNRFKFLRPVIPGECLRIETKKLTQMAAMAYIEGTIAVSGERVASGELSVAWG